MSITFDPPSHIKKTMYFGWIFLSSVYCHSSPAPNLSKFTILLETIFIAGILQKCTFPKMSVTFVPPSYIEETMHLDWLFSSNVYSWSHFAPSWPKLTKFYKRYVIAGVLQNCTFPLMSVTFVPQAIVRKPWPQIDFFHKTSISIIILHQTNPNGTILMQGIS